MLKNLFTDKTFLTIISGVSVYIISQLIFELYINRRKKYKEIREKIIYSISLYCCYYHSPYNLLDDTQNIRIESEYREASKEMRKIGAELAGYIGTIPKRKKKKIKKLKEALDGIIGLSNGFYIISENFDTYEANIKSERKIKENLDIE